MGHPDRGLLQASIDGELGEAEMKELRSHAEACEECRSELGTLEAASAAATLALARLDVEPEVGAARLGVRGRLKGEPTGRSFLTTWSLPRAASIALLLTGAAVSALPGSPVRQWIEEGWRTLTQPPGIEAPESNPVVPSEDPAASAFRGEVGEAGAGIAVSSEGVEIWLHGLSSDADLRVLWTDGEEAWVFAGEGTRFTSTDGRLEALDPPGPVRVEIPRAAGRVVLGLDGNVLLRKSGDEVEILGPVQERSPAEIRFGPSRAPNDGGTRGVSNP